VSPLVYKGIVEAWSVRRAEACLIHSEHDSTGVYSEAMQFAQPRRCGEGG
jgi:hypothetical protein